MNEDQLSWICLFTLIVGLTVIVCFAIGLDKRQERIMAEHGYCYQSNDRANVNPVWQYQKCK